MSDVKRVFPETTFAKMMCFLGTRPSAVAFLAGVLAAVLTYLLLDFGVLDKIEETKRLGYAAGWCFFPLTLWGYSTLRAISASYAEIKDYGVVGVFCILQVIVSMILLAGFFVWLWFFL